MVVMIESNWQAFAAVLLLGLLVAWALWGRKNATRERHRAPDALDEGVGPAKRNQALIDAPSAATLAAGLADTGAGTVMAGMGEVIAAGAAREVSAAGRADEEAGAPAVPVPADAPTMPEADEDLTRIKGLGPKLKTRLAELGITRFAQIAAWTEADIIAIDAQLGTFAGRATRDQWVAQAGFLSAGDVAGYEAKFGKL